MQEYEWPMNFGSHHTLGRVTFLQKNMSKIVNTVNDIESSHHHHHHHPSGQAEIKCELQRDSLKRGSDGKYEWQRQHNFLIVSQQLKSLCLNTVEKDTLCFTFIFPPLHLFLWFNIIWLPNLTGRCTAEELASGTSGCCCLSRACLHQRPNLSMLYAPQSLGFSLSLKHMLWNNLCVYRDRSLH